MSRFSMCNPELFQYDGSGSNTELIQEQQADAEAENPTCSECYEVLTDRDELDMCHGCYHECDEDYPCSECLEFAADRLHDSYDLER